MKIGIDINDSVISNQIKEKLKDYEYQVVDIYLKNIRSIGEEVFRKAILVNASRLDFFLSIKILEKENSIKIYYEENGLSKKFSYEILKKLRELKLNDVSLENGEDFYLIKNTDVPTILIKINLKALNINKEILGQKIIECIKCIDNIS
ncbi:N-acetylmuramoyl-L-alanine amidase [Clostridium baratii]|nr:N-acetylmuramoyl-L-alanine amidase [Clostridium baratii]MBT9831294.1 hypothetical protein [Clostridium baratii]MDY3207998.1 N-acetylmuramoyl-L-alanine amidase [Clostridium baratii]STB00321.1 Uncharacterised protein [Clostridium baratii]